MITRKVDKNDSLAGFIYNWVKKIGAETDKLIVICQEKGNTEGLPGNIEIYSLGKEKGKNKLSQLIRFKLLLLRHVKRADGVFAHMMPIYSIIAGPFCLIYRKKLIQWYMHRSVDWKLRLTKLFVSEYVTASKLSFRMKTKKKVNILGHGIDTNLFQATPEDKSDFFRLITIGRISPTKDYESMIKAIYDLSEKGIKNIRLNIIGAAGLKKQKIYFDNLKTMVTNMKLENSVKFLGPIANNKTPEYLKQSDLFINLSNTGSLDKAVLEAMSSACIAVSSNEAFVGILPDNLMVEKDNPKALADKIESIIALDAESRKELQEKLRAEVQQNHNLDNLVKKIINLYK
jgi:glycosyltransferase involved in cell wall biosynthesis